MILGARAIILSKNIQKLTKTDYVWFEFLWIRLYESLIIFMQRLLEFTGRKGAQADHQTQAQVWLFYYSDISKTHCYQVNDCRREILLIRGDAHLLRHCRPFVRKQKIRSNVWDQCHSIAFLTVQHSEKLNCNTFLALRASKHIANQFLWMLDSISSYLG